LKSKESIVPYGTNILKDHLVNILTNEGIKSPEDIAKHVINSVTEEYLNAEKDAKRMSEVLDISLANAKRIISLISYAHIKNSFRGQHIRGPEDVYKLLKYMADYSNEYFTAIYLNAKSKIISIDTITIGVADQTVVHPKEFYKNAISYNAMSAIAVHNHPSGDPDASPEDDAVTRKLSDAGDTVCIKLIDHIIIGTEGYYSYAEKMRIVGHYNNPSIRSKDGNKKPYGSN